MTPAKTAALRTRYAEPGTRLYDEPARQERLYAAIEALEDVAPVLDVDALRDQLRLVNEAQSELDRRVGEAMLGEAMALDADQRERHVRRMPWVRTDERGPPPKGKGRRGPPPRRPPPPPRR